MALTRIKLGSKLCVHCCIYYYLNVCRFNAVDIWSVLQLVLLSFHCWSHSHFPPLLVFFKCEEPFSFLHVNDMYLLGLYFCRHPRYRIQIDLTNGKRFLYICSTFMESIFRRLDYWCWVLENLWAIPAHSKLNSHCEKWQAKSEI